MSYNMQLTRPETAKFFQRWIL